MLFEPPQKADTHNYLARMDFYAGLPDNVAVTDEIPRLRRRDRSNP